MLQKVYGESCLTAVYELFGQFQNGREGVIGDDRSDRPSATSTDENIALVAVLFKKDRRITCRLVARRFNNPK